MRLTRLKEERKRAGLSQDKLAQRIGMTGDNVARLERLEHEPRFSTVEKLAQALGVEPEDLVDDPAELHSKKGSALSNLSVRYWLRERGAERFSYADRTYVQERIVPAKEGGVDALLGELDALTGEYRAIKDALRQTSRLPRAVHQRRKELRRDASRAYWRRVRYIDTTVYRLLEEAPEVSDEAIEERRERYDQRAAEIRRAA